MLQNEFYLQPLLARLETDLRENPQRIKPIQPQLVKQAQDLIKGVKVDLNGPLTSEV